MTVQIVMLAQNGPSTRILFRMIQRSFPDCRLILEPSIPRREMVFRRLRRLGIVRVLGQVAFLGLVVPILRARSRERVAAIKEDFELDDDPLGVDAITVSSVNSAELRAHLERLNPSVIVIN